MPAFFYICVILLRPFIDKILTHKIQCSIALIMNMTRTLMPKAQRLGNYNVQQKYHLLHNDRRSASASNLFTASNI